MGFLNKLFGKKDLPEDRGLPEPKQVPEMPKVKKPRKPRAAKKEPVVSEKQLATERGDPYIAILSVDLDPDNIGNGAFELDWNDKFLANLIRAGYQSKPGESEHIIVDRWFRSVCQNVLLENFEQELADPEKRSIVQRDIGNGRTEVS